MKFLAAADLHLGASPGFGAVPHGPGSRLDDQQAVWYRICRLAIEEKVDGVLWAGDAFHRRRPTPSEMMVWRGGVEMLGDEGIGIVGILGNHDLEAADRAAAPEVIRGPGYYDIFNRPGISYAFEDVAIACLPWTSPARLLASLNGQVERDEVATRVAELLIDTAVDLRGQIDDGKTAILVAHWSVSGSSLPNGLPVDLLREPVLPLSELEALGFGLVVLGHIHKGQVCDVGSPGRAGPIFYTGSPALVDWGESRIPHGVWIYDTETKALRHHEIEDRRFVTVDVDLTGGPRDVDLEGEVLTFDETDLIAEAISEHLGPLNGGVLRIRYRATPEQARRVDVVALKGFCHEAGVHKLTGIFPEIVRPERARVEGMDESMGELEAVDKWAEANFAEIQSGRHAALRERTARYLEAASV